MFLLLTLNIFYTSLVFLLLNLNKKMVAGYTGISKSNINNILSSADVVTFTMPVTVIMSPGTQLSTMKKTKCESKLQADDVFQHLVT